MVTALRDENFVTSGLAVLNTDTVQGQNLVRVAINGNNNGMVVDNASTISFTMVPIDPRDQNYVHCLTFTGSDGLVYPWVATSSGAVLTG
jgi:hypothetical protein